MKGSLGDRMKAYEHAYNIKLPIGLPVIIRVDGKAFHTYTRGAEKPFDTNLMNALDVCAIKLCSQISGAQLAFLQSDEISLLLHGYKTQAQDPWFDNKIQKIVSVAAAIASTTMTMLSSQVFKKTKPAYFDARAFVLPERDVCNYFLWRQQDWSRNSVQMLARTYFSNKECHKKNNSELQDMLMTKKINWNNLSTQLKRGRCVIKEKYMWENNTLRTRWVVDKEIPIFSQDRNYIEKYLETEL